MTTTQTELETRLMKLFKGKMADYSKIIKIIQYLSVLTSEYGLYRYHLRGIGLKPRLDGLIGGPQLTEEQDKDLKARYKKLGSALSTVRMFTRMGDFIQLSAFFINKFGKILSGQYSFKDLSMHELLKWVMEVCDFCSELFDNWYYFVRIGALKWSTPW